MNLWRTPIYRLRHRSRPLAEQSQNHPARGSASDRAGVGPERFRLVIRESVLIDGDYVIDLVINEQRSMLVVNALGVAELLDELAMSL